MALPTLSVALGGGRTRPARKGNRVTSSEERTVSEQLALAENSEALGGLIIEIWRGGGLPPPYYKSDQLRLLSANGTDSGEFASPRFDSHFDPAAVQNKWTAPVSSADIKEAAHVLLSMKLLATQFPEEQNPDIADAFSYEIIVSVNKLEVKRRYYRQLPNALSLQPFLERMTALAKTSGAPKLFHQGKEVRP